VSTHVVVAFRMPPAGLVPGPEGAYLTRARSMCSRGEALGGRLIGWSAALLAIAWDMDSLEEALLLATSIREEALTRERAWSCGMAEGELEPLAPDGARMQLAWGDALVSAASLARIARGGEVLVDGDVRAVRAGQLSLVGSRAATDAGQRVRGWRLDLEHPWKRAGEVEPGADATDAYVAQALEDPPSSEDPLSEEPVSSEDPASSEDLAGSTLEMPVADFSAEELSTYEILQIVEAADASPPPPSHQRRGNPLLAERIRSLAGDETGGAMETLADLRRVRADAEGGPPAARCQAALALAMGLALAGRPEEALLETVDALARAREADDTRAIGACMALLAKLYAGAGRTGEAAALRESSGAG
jgi:hypothetical protein